MACPNCATPMTRTRPRDEKFEYQDRLESDGMPAKVDYRRKNRRITRVHTYDRHLTFVWTPDMISFHGPKGSEVIVTYTLR